MGDILLDLVLRKKDWLFSWWQNLKIEPKSVDMSMFNVLLWLDAYQKKSATVVFKIKFSSVLVSFRTVHICLSQI